MDTLTTHYTGAVSQVQAHAGYYHGMVAAVFQTQGAYTLNNAASFYTAAAKYALIGISEEGGGGKIFGQPPGLHFKWVFTDTIFFSQILQFTIAISNTIQTVLRMIGKYKFEYCLSGLNYFRGSGFNNHSFENRL
jgi:hypothetical protein